MTGRIAVLTLLLGAGCATTSKAYLARVNDEVITGRELRAEFARHHYAMEEILGDEQEVRKYVDRLVERRLFVQEAYRMGLQDAPVVQDALARFRAQKVVEAYVKERVDDRATVTEAEVRAAHGQMNRQVEALLLVVATRAEAEAALAALRQGADFDALARERSIVPSAKRGGLILVGYGAEEVLVQALAPLKEGELSAPFQALAGWELVRLEHRKDAELPPYDKVAPQLRTLLQQRRRAALEQELYGPLWTRYEAKVLDCAPTVEALKQAAAAKATTPCATWNGGAVTVEALARRVKLEQLAAVAGGWPDLRKAVVEDLVARELVRREAEAAGYDRRPEVLEKVAVYQDDQVESLLYREYVIRDVKAGDAEARAYYEGHRDLFTEDQQYELAQVVVGTLEEAQQVVEKLTKARQPFGEVARAHSKDASAASGGKVGFVDKRRLVDPFAPVLALKEGEISAPLASPAGYHVVKLLSVKPARPLPFEEVAAEARTKALEERQFAETRRWVDKLRAAARIEVSEPGITAYSRERTAALARSDAAKQAAAAAKQAATADDPTAGPPPATPPVEPAAPPAGHATGPGAPAGAATATPAP
jgi:parvulin-like peptidyl-prolyl isomerase